MRHSLETFRGPAVMVNSGNSRSRMVAGRRCSKGDPDRKYVSSLASWPYSGACITGLVPKRCISRQAQPVARSQFGKRDSEWPRTQRAMWTNVSVSASFPFGTPPRHIQPTFLATILGYHEVELLETRSSIAVAGRTLIAHMDRNGTTIGLSCTGQMAWPLGACRHRRPLYPPLTVQRTRCLHGIVSGTTTLG